MQSPSNPESVIAELCAARRGNVCFDADGVLWREDAGNEYLLSCLERHILKPEQEKIARQGWDDAMSGAIPDSRMAEVCAEVLQGLEESFVETDARTFMQRRFRGLLIPDIVFWIARLQSAGVKCWAVSGTNQWCVTAGAAMTGIPKERVLAVANVVRRGVLTGELERPIPYGPGKAEAIRARLPSPPEMCFGNSGQDIPMLRLATRLAVAVEPDAALREAAQEAGWTLLLP